MPSLAVRLVSEPGPHAHSIVPLIGGGVMDTDQYFAILATDGVEMDVL